MYLGTIPVGSDQKAPAVFYDFSTVEIPHSSGFIIGVGLGALSCQVNGLTLDYAGPPKKQPASWTAPSLCEVHRRRRWAFAWWPKAGNAHLEDPIPLPRDHKLVTLENAGIGGMNAADCPVAHLSASCGNMPQYPWKPKVWPSSVLLLTS
jgi:hypothetical protein